MKNKPELISFSDPLLIREDFSQKMFFRPEIEWMKSGDIQSLINSEPKENPLIEIIGKVAILRIEGSLRPGRDWFFSVGYGDIQDAAAELMANESIDTVLEVIDSPGGTVKEAFETENALIELAKKKNLIAITTGSMTSGAALLSFPAKKRYISSLSNQLGSIGVVSVHIDERKWFEDYMGEVRTSVAQFRLKDAGSSTRTYDAKAKEVYESSVMELVNVFVSSAERGLNLTREQIESQESAVFIGQKGIDAGLADGISSVNDLIEQFNSVSLSPVIPAFSNHIEVKNMDINKVKADFPAECEQIEKDALALGKKEGKLEHAGDKEAGILDERTRAADVKSKTQPGCEALIEEMIKDGTPATEAAGKILDHITAKREKAKTNIESGLNEAISTDTPDVPDNPDKPADISKMSEEDKLKKAWEMNTEFATESSMKAYFAANPAELDNLLQGGE